MADPALFRSIGDADDARLSITASFRGRDIRFIVCRTSSLVFVEEEEEAFISSQARQRKTAAHKDYARVNVARKSNWPIKFRHMNCKKKHTKKWKRKLRGCIQKQGKTEVLTALMCEHIRHNEQNMRD